MGTKAIIFLSIVSLCLIRGDDSLASKIYTSFTGNPCVWLLDNEGGHGCHTTRDGRVGVLRFISNESALEIFKNNLPSKPEVLVMESRLALPHLEDLLKDDIAPSIAGILVLEGPPPDHFSPAEPIPGAKDATGFKWNPQGNGLLNKAFPYPLWALGVNDSAEVKEKAIWNNNRTSFPYYAAELVAFMHPRSEDTAFSSIRQSTSKPLGGHSILSTLTPYNATQGKEVVMAITGIDSASLFQMKTIGANADISGVVALMAAIDALLNQSLTPVEQWKRHPLFAFFDGEHWGSLGSTQFIHDLHNFTCHEPAGKGVNAYCNNPWAPSTLFTHIKYDKIHSIIEPKQVGAPHSDGALFVHEVHHQFNSPVANAALKSRVPGLVVSRASDVTGPNLPPSSLASFIRFDPKLADKGVVLTDHVDHYKNKYYNSIFDTWDNVDATLVCKAATAIAQAVSVLGRDVDPVHDMELTLITANCSLVAELLDCMTRNNTCMLRQELLPGLKGKKKVDEFPVHYSSVYFPSSYSEHQKFIHNWVSDRTYSVSVVNRTVCDNDDQCDKEAKETCLRGYCLRPESTFYHEAKNLNCDYEIGALSAYYVIHNTSDTSIFWTESDWTPIGLRVFLVTDPSIDYVFLGVALVEVLIVIIASYLANRFFSQKFKVL